MWFFLGCLALCTGLLWLQEEEGGTGPLDGGYAQIRGLWWLSLVGCYALGHLLGIMTCWNRRHPEDQRKAKVIVQTPHFPGRSFAIECNLDNFTGQTGDRPSDLLEKLERDLVILLHNVIQCKRAVASDQLDSSEAQHGLPFENVVVYTIQDKNKNKAAIVHTPDLPCRGCVMEAHLDSFAQETGEEYRDFLEKMERNVVVLLHVLHQHKRALASGQSAGERASGAVAQDNVVVYTVQEQS
ncbi:uncharacterized protein LOC121915585 [Sceloporus undulatus]|uniref:uncharacterized protein LOC121915585 n=1 Tax=Sceloporus undulatus TaxID=8520 RepID=UPI001C4C45EB|nr:uncharacterized protein LOC121915585 [Sceloporus undulatus]